MGGVLALAPVSSRRLPVKRLSCFKKFYFTLGLFSDHISTTFLSHPNFMAPPSINVDARSRPKCFFLWLCVVWVGYSQLAIQNKVRCKPTMGMGWIVRVRPVAPRENMVESPSFDFFFCLLA